MSTARVGVRFKVRSAYPKGVWAIAAVNASTSPFKKFRVRVAVRVTVRVRVAVRVRGKTSAGCFKVLTLAMTGHSNIISVIIRISVFGSGLWCVLGSIYSVA